MTWLLLFVHVVALALWLGETIFLGAVVAPTLFGGLTAEQAGNAMALIFPAYYVVGYVCGALLIATATALRQRSRPGGGVWAAAATIAVISLAACLYAGLVVLPRADALRPRLHDPAAPAAVREEFDAAHRLAVQLNSLVLVGNLAIAGVLAARLGSGIRSGRRLSRYSSDPLR
jgi:hypothetical protein